MMEEKFKDILNTDKVKGVILVSSEGDIIFEKFNMVQDRLPGNMDWGLLVRILANVREADLIFESHRMYLRKTPVGHLFVLMGNYGPMAMVRLHCDLLLPNLEVKSAARGLMRFFRKKV
jgi:hypothetical protein